MDFSFYSNPSFSTHRHCIVPCFKNKNGLPARAARDSSPQPPPPASVRAPHFAPPHCPNTWRAEPQKEKCPFHFRKNHPRKNKKSKEHFSFWGCRVKRGGGGAFVERTIQFQLTSPHSLDSKLAVRCDLFRPLKYLNLEPW